MAARLEAGEEAPLAGTGLLMVPYTRKPNAYYDRVMGRVSPAAWLVLDYLVRLTYGYNRLSVDLREPELADATGLPLRTVQRAKAELRAAGIIDVGDGRGRGRSATHTMTAPTSWRLPEKSASVADYDGESTKSATLADYRARPDSKPAQAIKSATQADFRPSKNPPKMALKPATQAGFSGNGGATGEAPAPGAKPAAGDEGARIPTIPERKKERDMRATHASAGGSSSASPKPTKPPKEADPQSAYTQELVTALQDAMGAKIANWPRERKAAAWYFTAGADGGPAPIPDVMACYRETVDDPWWDGKPIGLEVLKTRWSARVARAKRAHTATSAARAGARVAPAQPYRPQTPPARAYIPASAASMWDD
jgi:hypothetical protein